VVIERGETEICFMMPLILNTSSRSADGRDRLSGKWSRGRNQKSH
jgi:hypothetical protein